MQSLDFSHFLRTQLNENQQKAVLHQDGPLLVVAGAGSGKTRVITARIVNLLQNREVLPTAIVALTFTNKAAQEMKERIKTFIPKGHHLPFIGTFHSYCLQLLKANPHLLDQPNFSLMDGDDQLKLVQSIVNRMQVGKRINARQIVYQISRTKNGADEAPEPLVKQVAATYEAEKKASHVFDFDDLLLETLKLFQRNKEFKQFFQMRVRHLLIDEYQDTNTTQHALLKEMSLNNKEFTIDSLCAVGDEDQSIYSWRGATVANMLNFKKDFPATTTFTIDQNYRSAQTILDIANHVITHNKNRNPKTLWSAKQGTDRIRTLTCLSGYQEADMIATFLRSHVAAKLSLNDVAILYRAHYQSRTIEEALLKNSIAYRIIGGIQFYERAEIKDLLAYLRLIVNPFDRIAFFRVVNTPARGLGEKFEELVHEQWAAEPLLHFQALIPQLLPKLTKQKQTSLRSFLKLFEDLAHTDSPLAALEKVVKATDYYGYLDQIHEKEEAEAKKDNIKELLQAVSHFETQGINSVAQFLQEVALMQEHTKDNNERTERVQLMTMHAAKGLEFHTVIIIGLEEGMLPGSRALNEPDHLEEERRLFYVGITRAEERLILTSCRFRHLYGQLEMQVASRFLSEIPQPLLHEVDCSQWQNTETIYYFTRWLQGIAPEQTSLGTVNIKSSAPNSFATKITAAPQRTFTKVTPKKLPVQESVSNHQSPWKKNQPVKHPTFGIGIIQVIEKRDDNRIVLTAQFKDGVKKLDSKFVTAV
jgi:DNA helicase-2/ATP-dependent DNA helicase PcrA